FQLCRIWAGCWHGKSVQLLCIHNYAAYQIPVKSLFNRLFAPLPPARLLFSTGPAYIRDVIHAVSPTSQLMGPTVPEIRHDCPYTYGVIWFTCGLLQPEPFASISEHN